LPSPMSHRTLFFFLSIISCSLTHRISILRLSCPVLPFNICVFF
jgi:hypothetical protein